MSCPYAPTFCIGDAPTVPGIPLSDSIPYSCCCVVKDTKSSSSSPELDCMSVGDICFIPFILFIAIIAFRLLSGAMELLPSPSIITGSFSFWAVVYSWGICCLLSIVVMNLTLPSPILNVVKFLIG